MKVVCAPSPRGFTVIEHRDLEIVLFGRADHEQRGSVGSSIKDVMRRSRLQPDVRAWDLMSIALSVIAADMSIRRKYSPDGWTREIDLYIAVSDPGFWDTQKNLLEQQLCFLTTDLWRCNFMGDGFSPVDPTVPIVPSEDCISLLSGGLDSLVGTLDLVTRHNRMPFVVSQVAHGNKSTQAHFAANIGSGLRHLQLNHNFRFPEANERSQRARSFIFLAHGVLAATALRCYRDEVSVPLYVCENGFISINPPLTDGRIGSLSTRTTHPIFMNQFQRLLDAAGLRVRIENPYQFHTKGEMLTDCADQEFLSQNAHLATSCGRYARNGYKHCGRCIPCLVRRAAFHNWGQADRTYYVYRNLALDDDAYARFDDVRSMALALAQAQAEGIDTWLGTSLSTTLMGDVTPYRQTVERGLKEIGIFFDEMGIR